MKKIKLIVSLLTILTAGMFCGIVCHADMVDELCEKYDYSSRWTIEVKLDNTYKNTWIYDMSDNGNIKITYIQFKQRIQLPEYKRSECFVFEGNETYIIDAINTYTADPQAVWVPSGDGYTVVAADSVEHPFHEQYIENRAYFKYKPEVKYYYGLNGVPTNQHIIISY